MQAVPIPRRSFLVLSGAALAAPFLSPNAGAAPKTGVPLHGLSAFGDLKYGPDFLHFDYATPDAPQGGTFNFAVPNWQFNQNTQTFNTLNTFVPRGDAPPRMELCFDSLMVRAIDEPDAVYGLLAETVTVAEDRNSYEFRLRPEARFHDGTAVTAQDAAATYRLFKEKGHPSLLLPLRELEDAVAVDPTTLRLVFSGEQSPRTILDVVVFPIVSKGFFDENPFDGSQMKAPLGSGRYRVGRVVAGQSITYERVEDYWGRDLPVNRGLNHFDRIRIDFFRDRQAGFEAFKKGEIFYRQEFVSKTWATEYDFPAFQENKVVKREFPSELTPSMQAWAVNQRRERFRDRRVREAIGLCFDFEWTRRNLFYDAYERSHSLFERSEFKAEGSPSDTEMALLERFRGTIPEEAFGEPVMQPQSDGSGRDRKLLREAARLLSEAGWTRRGEMLRNEKGQPLTLEILVQDPVFVRIDTPFVQNMRAVGIDASIRMVDSAQYQARQAEFDFDMLALALSLGATPTRDGLEGVFHSRSAHLPGSRNLPGTADPVVDDLLEEVGRAEDRESLATVMRVLDRVLRARRDWIPNWHAANHRAAYWDMFGFREPKPDYGFPVEILWWIDEEKAKAIGKA
jgi:microcin C transport system substrate-binding protein